MTIKVHVMKILPSSIIIHLLLNISITSAQDVGIGISTPRSNLHVYTGASENFFPFRPLVIENNTAAYINLTTPSAFESGLLFGNPSALMFGGFIYSGPATTPNGLRFRSGNITRMNLNNDGYLGIGNTNPEYLLDVSERMRLRSGGNFGL